jgi:hypothetical protein
MTVFYSILDALNSYIFNDNLYASRISSCEVASLSNEPSVQVMPSSRSLPPFPKVGLVGDGGSITTAKTFSCNGASSLRKSPILYVIWVV